MSSQDETEFIDSPTDTDTTANDDVVDTDESTEDSEGNDIETVRASNKKLFERAKAAEDKLRALKKERYDAQVNSQKPKLTNNDSSPIAEELKLIARGLSDEEIEEAKSIAKGKEISLPEALKTKTFLAYQKELKEEAKREAAKLGASKGSAQVNKETFRSGMTPEEHKALWQKSRGG